MALHDDQADILGGPILQRPDSGLFATFSQYRFAFKSAALLGLGLLMWIVCARGLEHLKKHRELKYRKAMRRKHGIPDSDCRPFAVAYAAAKRAHLEREAQDQKKTTNYVSDHNLPPVDQRTDAQKDMRGLRQRVPETTVRLYDDQLSGNHAASYDNKRPEIHSLDFIGRYNPNPHRRAIVPEQLSAERPPVRRTSRKDPNINMDSGEESRKRSFEDEGDIEHETTKKSRIDGGEFIDGDGQADWYTQYADLPQRLSGETLDQQNGDDYQLKAGQEWSERVNDSHDEDHGPADEAMEGIDEDEVTELKAVPRGKKRDRAEAGSTFGGDDDDDIQNGRVSHHRKRRTIVRRGVDAPARGQKRDREVESFDSEDEGVGSETPRRRLLRSSKKKRGKNVLSEEVGDIPNGDSHVPKDHLCCDRRVGDEWEVDGVQYKVGDKGERLRLALVKKARNKYHMPQDSQHPDRSAALEIYVETWLTDEQYKQAEARRELAWQEPPREASGPNTPDVPRSPVKDGKNLLWDSVKGSPTRRPHRQLLPSGMPPRINPFEQWQLQPAQGRRVASSGAIMSPILPGVVDSPTRPGFRGFTKWEKQDREAEALARIRTKIEEQKKAQAPPQRSTEIPTSVTAPELGTKPLSVPTITFTPAPTVPEGDSSERILQSKSSASTSFANSPSVNDSTKSAPGAASTTTTGISLPSIISSGAVPSTFFPTAPTTLATSSTPSLSPLSFAKIPQITSTTIPSSATRSSLEKARSVPTTPPASAPSLSNSGATTQLQPPSLESTSKLSTKSDTSSSAPSPVVVASPAKSQVSNINATLNSSSTMMFGSTPAAAKTEALVPPPVAAPEGSKSPAPLFSFSGASSFTTTFPTSSTPSAPKFSLGQPPTASASTPGSNSEPASVQPKLTFKFSQVPPGSTNSEPVSKLPGADGLKKPAAVFGTAASSNEPIKPSPFGAMSAFGNLTPSSTLPPNIFGKPVTVDGVSSTPTPPKTALASASTTTFPGTFSSTPSGFSAPSNASAFSFGGANSGFKSGEVPISGGVTGGGSNPTTIFGGSSTNKKSTFAFAAAEGSKPTSLFVGNADGLKSHSIFGSLAGDAKPTFAFGSSAEMSKSSVLGSTLEGSKSTTVFSSATETKTASGPATESSGFSDAANLSKPNPVSGNVTFGPSSSSTSTFTFGKDDTVVNTPQIGAPPPFTFAAPQSATGSVLSQPSGSAPGGDSSQPIFGKPTNTLHGAFGFVGAGASGSSSAFTFAKPAAQNQKQEQ